MKALHILAETAPQTGELIIDIDPFFCVDWSGTAAALIDAGLIPDEFEWPEGKDARDWEHNGQEFTLRRSRPPGFKGPQKAWLGIDWWQLRTAPTSYRGHGFRWAHLYETRRAYEAALFQQSHAGQVQCNRHLEALHDVKFRAFLSKVTR